MELVKMISRINLRQLVRWCSFGLVFLWFVFFMPTTSMAKTGDQWISALSSVDIEDSDLERLLIHALSSDNLLAQSAAYEKLNSLTFVEIRRMLDSTKLQTKFSLLNVHLGYLLKHKNDRQLMVREDILLDCQPSVRMASFYKNDKKPREITSLSAQVEQIYNQNLVIARQRDELIQKDADTWVGTGSVSFSKNKKQISFPGVSLSAEIADQLTKRISWGWRHKLIDDKLHDYFFTNRQWFKKYEEFLQTPVYFKNYVVLRNEFRLFGLDVLTGKTLWTWSRPDTTHRECYQTLRQPHINSYGGELTLHADKIITELDGSLIALLLDSKDSPQLLWQQSLGEYSLCTRPLIAGHRVIVGIVNARGEINICSFDLRTGRLLWNRFVGLAASLSPVCTIGIIDEAHVFLGTNYGILICAKIDSGEIVWVKKYQPQKYNIFDYWYSPHEKAMATQRHPIKFNTNFLFKGQSQSLYYKPRESNYLYVLNPISGETEQKVYIAPDQWTLLKVIDGKAILLQKSFQSLDKENMKLVVFDLATGEMFQQENIIGGQIKGVVYPSYYEIVFKVGDALHSFNVKSGKHYTQKISSKGWLLFLQQHVMVSGDQGNFDVEFVGGEGMVSFANGSAMNSEQSLERPNKFFDQSAEGKENVNAALRLVKENNSKAINKRRLQHKKKKVSAQFVSGEQMDIVPIHTGSGPETLDFFLLKRFDQALCVQETGEIKWVRKFFFPKKAFLYNDVLVVVDLRNVVGVNVHTGEYIWSMTVEETSWDKNLTRSLVQAILVEDRLVILEKQRLYFIDPLTGHCAIQKMLPSEQYIIKEGEGENFCLLDKQINALLVGDKTGNIKRLDLAEGDTFDGKVKNFFMLGQNVVVCTNKRVYLVSSQTGNSIAEIKIPANQDFFIEKYRDSFLIIYPGVQVSYYSFEGGKLCKKWERNIGVDDFGYKSKIHRRELWNAQEMSYLLIDNRIFFAAKKKNVYSLVVLDVEHGYLLCEVPLKELNGKFEGIFLGSIRGNKGVFTIMLTCIDNMESKPMLAEACGKAWLSDLHVYFCEFELDAGKLVKLVKSNEGYKTFNSLPSQLPTGTQTKRCLVNVVNGQYLYVETIE